MNETNVETTLPDKNDFITDRMTMVKKQLTQDKQLLSQVSTRIAMLQGALNELTELELFFKEDKDAEKDQPEVDAG